MATLCVSLLRSVPGLCGGVWSFGSVAVVEAGLFFAPLVLGRVFEMRGAASVPVHRAARCTAPAKGPGSRAEGNLPTDTQHAILRSRQACDNRGCEATEISFKLSWGAEVRLV